MLARYLSIFSAIKIPNPHQISGLKTRGMLVKQTNKQTRSYTNNPFCKPGPVLELSPNSKFLLQVTDLYILSIWEEQTHWKEVHICLPFSYDNLHLQILVLSQNKIWILSPMSFSNLEKEHSPLTRGVCASQVCFCVLCGRGPGDFGRLPRHFPLFPCLWWQLVPQPPNPALSRADDLRHRGSLFTLLVGEEDLSTPSLFKFCWHSSIIK